MGAAGSGRAYAEAGVFLVGLPSWAAQADNVSGGRVVKSASITLSSGIVRFVASLGTAVILGRLLSPDDFGLVGMVMPLVALVTIFADGGVSFYTLRSRDLNQADVSLTFWLSAAVGTFLAIVFFASAPLIATFYDEPRLAPVAAVLALTFFISVFASQHNALVKRCYRQDLFAIAEIAGSLSGLLAGVAVAITGGGYWALVAAPLVRQCVHSILIWILTRWIPGAPHADWNKIKAILSFGWLMIFSIALGALTKNVDKVLLGWQFDTREVGYYTMAYSIMMLPVWQVLTPVGGAVVPYLSQIRSDPEKLRQGLQVLVVVLGVAIAPAMLWAALIAEPLLRFVLGEQWVPSARIFSLLALASISTTFAMPLGWSFVACDQPKKYAIWTSSTFIPIIAAFALGLPWGGVGVATAYLIVMSIVLLLFPWFAARHLPVLAGDYLKAIAKVMLLAGASGLLIFMVLQLTQWGDLATILATAVVLLLSVPALFLAIFGRPYADKMLAVFRRKGGPKSQ